MIGCDVLLSAALHTSRLTIFVRFLYLLLVGIHHGLRDPLPLVVAGAGPDWVDVAPVSLTLRVFLRVSVDLVGSGRARGWEERGSLKWRTYHVHPRAHHQADDSSIVWYDHIYYTAVLFIGTDTLFLREPTLRQHHRRGTSFDHGTQSTTKRRDGFGLRHLCVLLPLPLLLLKLLLLLLLIYHNYSTTTTRASKNVSHPRVQTDIVMQEY